jgi:dephospho-CoA kinase
MRVIAIVGMAGSGKTEAARFFESHGFVRVRFGEVVAEELKRRGLKENETNERLVREEFRTTYGMDAFAKLNLPRIEEGLKAHNVVMDGMYSLEEMIFLKDRFKEKMKVVAIHASPAIRHARLAARKVRPLTKKECEERDLNELVKANKGGPIALADFMVVNESTVEEMNNRLKQLL